MDDKEVSLRLNLIDGLIEDLQGRVFKNEMFSQSESIKELSKAMVKAQMAIEDPKKSTENTFFKSKYADLSEVRAALRQPMFDAGIAYFQFPHVVYSQGDDSRNPPMVHVVTKLVHAESGEWVSATLSVVPKDGSPQSVGSAITYLRRYCLKTILGMADEDDDGNEGSGRQDQPQGKPTGKHEGPPPPNRKAENLGNLKKPEDIKDAKGRVRWVQSKKCFDDAIQAEEGCISTAEFHQISALVTVNIKPTKEKTERAIFGAWLKAVYAVDFFNIKKEMFAGIVETLKTRPQEIQNFVQPNSNK